MNQNQNIPIEPYANLFEQVDQQVAQGQPAVVLVERTNGDITTAQVAGITEGKTNAFFGDITDGPKNDMPYKQVGNEFLTDKYQAHLAEKLAGVVLQDTIEAPKESAAASTTPDSEPIDPKEKARQELQELTANMDEEQQRLLSEYAIKTDDITLHDRRGNYNGANTYMSMRRDIQQKMSPDTLSKLDKYMSLWKAKSSLDLY